MNVLLLVLIAIALWRGFRGMQMGFVEELSHLFMLVVALFVLSLGIFLYTSIKAGDTKNIVLSVIMIVIVGTVVRIAGYLTKTLSAIARLPVLKALNGLFGAIIGVAEVVVGIWIVYLVFDSFDIGPVEQLVMQWTNENEVLSTLYSMNKLPHWLLQGF